MLRQELRKPVKVATCQCCGGVGRVTSGCYTDVCPQCEGVGRVWVRVTRVLEILPYRDEDAISVMQDGK